MVQNLFTVVSFTFSRYFRKPGLPELAPGMEIGENLVYEQNTLDVTVFALVLCVIQCDFPEGSES